MSPVKSARVVWLLVLASMTIIGACGSDTPESSCGVDSCGLCPDSQTGLKICSFVATPTASESITLKNYSTSLISLQGYSLWDANTYANGSGQKTFISSESIGAGATLTVGSLPFVINDSGETLYLKNANGSVLHTRGN